MLAKPQVKTIFRARAPLRISFGGGGTDVKPYCDERGGAVLNATINRYAHATVVPGGETFEVRSLDYDAVVSYGIRDPFVYDGQLDLVKAVLDAFRRESHFDEGLAISLHNDAPPGSGLGSSSAITVAIVRAIALFLRVPMDGYQIAELAYRVEREDVGIEGGKQDHYAAAFGGFNFIEFKCDDTVVVPLRLRRETLFELESSMVFAYVGGQHFSGKLIERQIANYQGGVSDAINAMDALKDLAYEMKRTLLLGRLREFGDLLNIAWENKKRMATGITNPAIDEVYDAARKAGALGGKISGAGGGGYMFFLCEPSCLHKVQDALKAAGAQLVHFSFTEDGVSAWTLS